MPLSFTWVNYLVRRGSKHMRSVDGVYKTVYDLKNADAK